MHLPRSHSLHDALLKLTDDTGTSWTRTELLEGAIKHSLQIWGTTPPSSAIVIPGTGGDRDAGYSASSRRLALLLVSDTKDLLVHGQATTRCPAWEPGDPDYCTWDTVVKRRAELGHNAVGARQNDVPLAPFMGESDICFFAEAVLVTDETCRVPAATLATLAQAHSLQLAHTAASQPARAVVVVRGITKAQAVQAFGTLVNVDLQKRLGDGEGIYGDSGARVQHGTRGGRHASLWNPILLAVHFNERNSVPWPKLNRAFHDNKFLVEWWDEWHELSEQMK